MESSFFIVSYYWGCLFAFILHYFCVLLGNFLRFAWQATFAGLDMRKIMLLITICVVLIFTGCSSIKPNDTLDTPPSTQQEKATKSCKLEVLSAQDDTLLKTIDDQDAVSKFFQADEWKEVDKLPQDLVPEFKLDIYQEKTLLAGQDPNTERGYEIIVSINTFKDSSYVEESISSDMVKNTKIPDKFLTFYYNVPDDIIKELRQLLQ